MHFLNQSVVKQLLLSAITLIALTTGAQQITSTEWDAQAAKDIRLLPKYGYKHKTHAEKQADKKFITATLKDEPDKRKASNHLIRLGFSYVYKDLKTAMYRFNQAYLIDSTNEEIYWGFGGVYMVLGDYEKAKEQYQQGLAINPNNVHLLTDYGTYFMTEYYALQPIDAGGAALNLNTAINYLTDSYKIDSTYQNTSYKLSACYWAKGDCDNARKYFNACKALGGAPITEEFERGLKESCK